MSAQPGHPLVTSVRNRVRRTDPTLLLACAIFLAVGWWSTPLLPVGHEEISTFPARPARVLVPGPHGLEFEPSCANSIPPVMARSEARPVLSLCAGGLSLPVLIMPYAAGFPYWHALASWPLHRGDPFWLRRWDLLAGVLSLVMAHRLVERLTDALTASVAVLMMSVSAPFVVLHAMLLQYEAMPWILMMGAALVALGPVGPARPSASRLAVAALLAGLAVTANVKAVFYLGPLLLVATLSGALRRVGRRAFWAAPVAALGVAPLFAANLVHGGRGLESQAGNRASLIARHTSLQDITGELVNLLRFGSDTGSYGTATWARIAVFGALAAGICAVGVGYVTVAAIRFVVTRRENPLAATCGVLVVLFVVISLKIYDQRPAANYGPLCATFAICVALAIAASAKKLCVTGWFGLADPRRTALALAAVCMAPMGVNTGVRLAGADTLPLSTNPLAERQIAAYLMSHPSARETLYTTTYNLAGVLDSLGRGEISTVRLDRALRCDGRDTDPRRCLSERWSAFLGMPGSLPARVVLPSVETLTDERDAMLLTPALMDAARALEVSVVVEHQFSIGTGPVAMTLVRVSRSPTASLE